MKHRTSRSTTPGILILALFAGLLVLAPVHTARAEDPVLGGNLEKQPKTEAEIQDRIQALSAQVRANPNNYRYHFELANWYVEAGDEEKAKASFERALELNPKFVEALVNLGGLYSDMGKQDDAVTYFQKALALDPTDCKARSNLGNAYYAMGRYPDAMFEYQRAVKQDPKCYSALYNIAVAFADAGLFREAVKWWDKVQRVAPGTDAARSARENIDILKPFTQPPTPQKTGGDAKNE